MLRLSRVAQVARGRPSSLPRTLKPAFLTPPTRNYSVPPTTHFQKGDIPPQPIPSAAGPKSYFQPGQAPPPPSGHFPQGKSRTKARLRAVLILLIAVTGGLYYMIPEALKPEISEPLREALMAESSSFGGQNPQEAIKYLIKAMKETEAQGVSPLSDEYTGMQLKLADLYMRLNYPDAADDIYKEILAAYFDAFQHNKVASVNRPHLIQRGLRVALRLVLNGKDYLDNVELLNYMVLVAQEEVVRRCPQAAAILDTEKMISAPTDREFGNLLAQAHVQARQLRMAGNFDAWMPFRDELIAARDRISLCTIAGNLPRETYRGKQMTYQMMLASGCGIGELLLAQANVASVFFFNSEYLEAVASRADKKEAAKLPPNPGMVSLARSELLYKRVLGVIPSLPPDVRRTKEVEEAQAMCTYGVGAVAMKKGEFDEAKDLLREARTRARGCGFDDLVDAAERELEKIDELAKEAPKKIEINKEEEKDDPENPGFSEIISIIANEEANKAKEKKGKKVEDEDKKE